MDFNVTLPVIFFRIDLQNMDTEGFGDLLRDAEQLTADVDSGGELPRVERNLRQIMETSERLWTKTAQVGAPDAADVKA